MTPPGTLSKHTKGTEAQVGERVSVSMLASLGPAHQALHAPWGWRGEQLSSCFPERRIWMQNAEAFNISILEETAGKGTPSWREWQAPCSWLWSDMAEWLNWTEQIVEKYYKAPLEVGTLLLMSMSEVFSATFTLNKIYTKLWVTETVFGPGVKSSSLETTNLVAQFAIHCISY